jgi:hypothetical protein
VKLGLDDSALALGISAAELGRRLRVAEMVCMEPHRQRRVAFAMGQHARLGAQSASHGLEAGLVQMVFARAEKREASRLWSPSLQAASKGSCVQS